MASPTQWMWIWMNSGSWWWTGRPGVLRFMGSQRVRHDWATELNWTPWKKGYNQPRQHIKKQRHYFANKGLSSQRYVFFSSHVRTWELDYKESWVLQNWCFWNVVLENTLQSPLDCKEINSINLKGNQPQIFFEGLMLKLKLQYFGHLMQGANGNPSSEKDWGQKKKGVIEDKIVG